MKVETDIITSMAVSLIPVIMDVKTFKTNVIVSICNIIMCLMSQTDDFQLDTDIIRDSSSILTLSETAPRYWHYHSVRSMETCINYW